MRRVFRLLSPMVCIALIAGFAAQAQALSPKQMESLLEESSNYAKDALGRAEEAPAGKRRELYDAIIERVDQDMALCADANAELLADWGDLYVDLAKETSNDIAFVFLDKAMPIFEKARDRDRKEEHVWTGLAEVHHVRAEKLFEAGQEEEARKQAEQGFAVFKEGEKYCPNSNFLYYMWGSNLVLRAYDVEGAERRALREEGIAKFSRAAVIEPDDQYSLRMAGTANLRMAEDMTGESSAGCARPNPGTRKRLSTTPTAPAVPSPKPKPCSRTKAPCAPPWNNALGAIVCRIRIRNPSISCAQKTGSVG